MRMLLAAALAIANQADAQGAIRIDETTCICADCKAKHQAPASSRQVRAAGVANDSPRPPFQVPELPEFLVGNGEHQNDEHDS